ncbi:MAG: hypothetical protein JXM74_09710 [Fusobacteriaceae bacterium]|nr:hypothetical protein [Fusobacteriaceae bacterium]MBN2839016.1 hypothetical protein [Fusobacteriaceae bacterium]
MRILMDNVEQVINEKEYGSLEFLLSQLLKVIETKGRVVTSVKIDGVNLDSLSVLSMEEIEMVEVTSQNPLCLLRETVKELSDYLDNYLNTLEEIIISLRVGERIKPLENLVDGIYGLEWIIEILKKSEELLEYTDKKLDIIYFKVDNVLSNLIKLVEEKNYDELSIILEFSLQEVLFEIKYFIPVIFEKLKLNLDEVNYLN